MSDTNTQSFIEAFKSELDSAQSVNVELKMRLEEANERGQQREQEFTLLQRRNEELESEVELVNLKLTQFSSSHVADRKVEDYLLGVDREKAASELRARNAYLEDKLAESDELVGKMRDQIKQVSVFSIWRVFFL
jgi:hypothetical protein